MTEIDSDIWIWQESVQQSIVIPTYQKVPVVRRLNFELQGCKVNISQNMVQRMILTFEVFLNLHSLLFKSLNI